MFIFNLCPYICQHFFHGQHFPAPAAMAARLIGQFVNVTISDALPHSLRGELVIRD